MSAEAPPSRTLELQSEHRERPRPRERAVLYVVLECSRLAAGGARYDVGDVDEVLVGRGSKRVLEAHPEDRTKRILRVPDRNVSSQHARIFREDDRWWVEDLGSTNGTRVAGVTVKRAPIPADAAVELGGTFVLLDPEVEAPGGRIADLDFEHSARVPLGLATLLPDYQASLDDLEQIALANVPILLLGETGTGKELLARAVHELSGRSGAFVPVNCGALPETLVESQLFGHVKGAFSGAARDEPGLVRASDRGTLFLDEIGELARPSQATLLRVLQEREVLPVGGTKPVGVDLRVVAATHQEVEAAGGDAFRRDLYARLAGFTLRVPPLRERRADMGVVLAGILGQIGPRAAELKIAPALARAFFAHGWPHNARELQQAMAVGSVLAADGTMDLSHLPETTRDALVAGPSSDDRRAAARSAELDPEEQALRDTLLGHLAAHKGNVSEVSRVMGKTRMQIHRWMKRFGLDPDDYRT